MAFNPNTVDNQLVGATDRARQGGSSHTVLLWNGRLIAFLRQMQIQTPTGVGPGVVPIHPLDAPYPVELITPMAATMGTIVLEMYELFGAKVWERLAGLNGTNDVTSSGARGPVDIVGIYRAVSNTDKPLRIVKVVKPPQIRGKSMKPYTEEYNNVVVASVEDGETIEIGTMEVLKRMTVNYTHVTRNGENDVLKKTDSLGTITDAANGLSASGVGQFG